MKLNEKSNITAAVGTVLFMTAVFLILWFVLIVKPQEEEDEGVMVSFGEVMDEGGGLPDAAPYLPTESSEAAAPESAAAPEPVLTQEDESAAEALRIKEEQRRAEAKAEAERKAKEKAEAERKAAEQRRQAEAVAKAQQMSALFGNTSSAEGANGQPGDNGKAINGNPSGRGSGGGDGVKLGDNLLYRQQYLPKPSADFKQEGTVVVRVIVDRDGKVVAAQVVGGTIGDYSTQQLALRAARQATFLATDRPDKEVGTITYNFKFK